LGLFPERVEAKEHIKSEIKRVNGDAAEIQEKQLIDKRKRIKDCPKLYVGN
jgi:hypothetical protein